MKTKHFLALFGFIIGLAFAGCYSVKAQFVNPAYNGQHISTPSVINMWGIRQVPDTPAIQRTWQSYYNKISDSLTGLPAGTTTTKFSFLQVSNTRTIIPSTLVGTVTSDTLKFRNGVVTTAPLVFTNPQSGSSNTWTWPNSAGTVDISAISSMTSSDTASTHGGTNIHCYGVKADTIMAKPSAWMTVTGSNGVTYKIPLYKN